MKNVSLKQQALEKKYRGLSAAHDRLKRDFYTLQDQHANLQDDFNFIAKIRIQELLEYLFKGRRIPNDVDNLDLSK